MSKTQNRTEAEACFDHHWVRHTRKANFMLVLRTYAKMSCADLVCTENPKKRTACGRINVGIDAACDKNCGFPKSVRAGVLLGIIFDEIEGAEYGLRLNTGYMQCREGG